MSTQPAIIIDATFAITAVNDHIRMASEAAYSTMATMITADINTQVSNCIARQARGETLFGEREPVCALPVIDTDYAHDECVVVYGSRERHHYYATNYGRLIVNQELKHPAGYPLTNEVITYLRAVMSHSSTCWTVAIRDILVAYQTTYATAVNDVYDTKVAAIRQECRAEADATIASRVAAQVAAQTITIRAQIEAEVAAERASLRTEGEKLSIMLNANTSALDNLIAEVKSIRRMGANVQTVKMHTETITTKQDQNNQTMIDITRNWIHNNGRKSGESFDAYYTRYWNKHHPALNRERFDALSYNRCVTLR